MNIGLSLFSDQKNNINLEEEDFNDDKKPEIIMQ